MRFTTAVAVAFTASISFVAAQDKCDAQNIVDSCVAGYQSRIDTCNETPNDFVCLCDVYRDVLVCYNNCPDSLEKPPVQNTVTSYCNAAEPLRAAASSSMASVASVAATQSRAQASETSATTSATGTASEDAPTSTVTSFEGAAGKNGIKAGAAIVALFGAAGLL
ncbi:gpi anchored serine-threonine rich protein [Stemphylium lycopersici]|uniref:Gpi anchored serine-threonine rich protein n=1 Tax=Stemphylium lycopersici TaxID=183478 RepID=A0A364NBR0_STELY|nr:gpi anchored serine-threonine rich protein [Stemphylium lycopersici]RAR14759.1 gpi anchored serine-threonine rich protein [Stemphylium lycopersici]